MTIRARRTPARCLHRGFAQDARESEAVQLRQPKPHDSRLLLTLQRLCHSVRTVLDTQPTQVLNGKRVCLELLHYHHGDPEGEHGPGRAALR